MNSIQFHGWLDRIIQPFSFDNPQKPLIMGILNITPDSFSDGGKFCSIDKACERAFEMIAQGVDIIDIGGESSKPGALPVPTEEEISKVIPVIQQIRKRSDICISIDTYKPEVMRAAVDAGANIINDIYALTTQSALETVAELGVPVCLMHMQGKPENMQDRPFYSEGVILAVLKFFAERLAVCVAAGIKKENIIIDPGFGFGKSVTDNLELTRELKIFKQFNVPLLLGVSRKSTIGAVLGKEVEDRLIGGIALTVYAALNGVDIIRTHDIDETNQALTMIAAMTKVAPVADNKLF